MTYQFVDVRKMPKSGGAPSTLAQTASMFAVNIVAPGNGVVVWSAAACALPCDYPGAGREQAVYTLDPAAPHGYRMIAGAPGGSQVAASATTVFSRRLNGVTGKWDMSACAIDGSGCTAIMSEASPAAALYADGGRFFWIREGPEGAQLFWNQAVAPYVPGGSMPFVPSAVALRVDGDAIAVRSGPEIWTGTLGGTMTRVKTAAWGGDIDISHGRIYWNQVPFGQFEGCLGTARLDGTDARCLEQGQHLDGTVRVDENYVWFIRDGQVARFLR
ncbi:MAG TPA: hypothetical protein VI356_07015 [Myxococcales bacterium]